jgi:hypothetical protein
MALMRARLFIVGSLALALVAGNASAAGVGTIKTGERTGPLKHGETTFAQVKKWFGAPDSTSSSIAACGETDLAMWGRKQLTVLFDRSDDTVVTVGVARERVRSTKHGRITWATDIGLRIGDGKNKMKRLYPDSHPISQNGDRERWRVDSNSMGLLVARLKTRKVVDLTNYTDC